MKTLRIALTTLPLLTLCVTADPSLATEGRAWGDIHVRTMDGAIYPFQAAGEYVASRSVDGDLDVQLRLESNGFSSNVSVTTRVAALVDTTAVSVALRRQPALFVDGKPATLRQDALDLPGGGRIERSGRSYEIYWGDGSMLTVDVRKRHMDVFLRPAEIRQGTLSGLFGNFNGDAGDDVDITRVALGSGVLSPEKAGLVDIARQLLDGDDDPRLLTQEDSLFEYEPGQSTHSFRRPASSREATAEALSPSRRRLARDVCEEAGVTDPDLLEACIVDVGYTRDESFVESALAVQERDVRHWDSELGKQAATDP